MGAFFPLLFDKSDDATLNELLLSLGPTFYGRFNEVAGNLINYGLDGNTGVVSGAVQGQTGQLGVNEAYLFDGVDDFVNFTNASLPASKALTTQRWVFLLKVSSLGEGGGADKGRLFEWTSGTPGHRVAFYINNALVGVMDAVTTDALAITNNNQVDFIGVWALVFIDYDDSNAMGLGRSIRFFRATATSATTLLTLATNTPASGALVTPTQPFYIANDVGTAHTLAGLIDFAWGSAGLWTPTASPTNLSLMENIRKLVFNL